MQSRRRRRRRPSRARRFAPRRATPRTAAGAGPPPGCTRAGNRSDESARLLARLDLARGPVRRRRANRVGSSRSYPSRAVLAGIDLGGTQVRVALARSDGQLIASVKTKTHTLPTAEAMVEWAAAEID